MAATSRRLSITLPEAAGGGAVSALLVAPAEPRALLVLGHGAGAGMEHPFLEALAGRLAAEGVATLRYQFPYMEAGRRFPDRLPVRLATVRAAVARGRELARELAREPGREPPPKLTGGTGGTGGAGGAGDGGALPLFAGGKSMGGRMTSEAAAEEPLAGVAGLVFVGFPLHPAGKPGTDRASHLAAVGVPQLYLQGTRDKLAGLDLLRPVLADLGDRPTLHVVEGADHGFHVLKRSGRSDEEVLGELVTTTAAWMKKVSNCHHSSRP